MFNIVGSGIPAGDIVRNIYSVDKRLYFLKGSASKVGLHDTLYPVSWEVAGWVSGWTDRMTPYDDRENYGSVVWEEINFFHAADR